MAEPTPEMIEAAGRALHHWDEMDDSEPGPSAYEPWAHQWHDKAANALSAAFAAASKEWLLAQALTEDQLGALIDVLHGRDVHIEASAEAGLLLRAALALSTGQEETG